MRKFFKYLTLVLGVFVVAYYGSLILEACSGPSVPASTEKFVQHAAELDAIVDSHWVRPDAIATKDELDAYQNLIHELGKFDYAPILAQHERVKKLQAPSQVTYESRLARAGSFYRSLRLQLGDEWASVLTHIVHGPSVSASQAYSRSLNRHQSAAATILHLRAKARYHLAMAHALRDESDDAIEQLKLVLKETPDYGLINATYIIGARVNAEKDADFLAALEAAGGSSERFMRDYVDDGSPNHLYPFAGNRFYDPR